MSEPLQITQPFNDCRIRIGRTYIGCVNKENADIIMALQSKVSASEDASQQLKDVQTALVSIYRLLGPEVPEAVEDAGAAHEWRHALNIAKIEMAKFTSTAFYPGDGPPENPEVFVESQKP